MRLWIFAKNYHTFDGECQGFSKHIQGFLNDGLGFRLTPLLRSSYTFLHERARVSIPLFSHAGDGEFGSLSMAPQKVVISAQAGIQNLPIDGKDHSLAF
jgi:hypothetical protein